MNGATFYEFVVGGSSFVRLVTVVCAKSECCPCSFVFDWTASDDRAESRTTARVVGAGEIRFPVQITVSWAADEMKLLARAPAKRIVTNINNNVRTRAALAVRA